MDTNREITELAEIRRSHNGRFSVAAVYIWPCVQTAAWWIIAACQDFTDGTSSTVNCLLGVTTSVVKLAVGRVKAAI